jgi:predicted DNA-binding protein
MMQHQATPSLSTALWSKETNMEKKVYKQIGVRVSDELFKQLNELAKQKERSVSWICKAAIQEYLNKK